MGLLDFFTTALWDHRVGAIMPSSSAVVKIILARLPEPLNLVVEYGPGDGAITRPLLQKMAPTGRVIVIEVNHHFAQRLKGLNQANLVVHENDVLSVCRKNLIAPQSATAIISGIPFSFLSEPERDEIIAKTAACLKPGGVFIVYQVTRLVQPLLHKYFDSVEIKRAWLNLPPYWVMSAQKKT